MDSNNARRGNELENKGTLVRGSGYCYNQPETGAPLVEYHVDTYELFQEKINEEMPFGGKRSVRHENGQMLIMWG